ncbi:MAG: tetratricopeptide repeat protein, partial [Gemmatimonadetes bacterium]|nr:tetratricopeptide repeat protein [Gemmatimonadota bacterium]
MPCLKDPLLFFCFRVTLPLLVFAAIFLPQETAHGQTETPVGITVFFLDSELEDETAQWLQYGVPLAVALDLSQDPALDIRTVPMFPGRLRRMGFPDLVGVGYSSGRFITRGHESEWFVLGRVSSVGGTIGVDFELHPARLSIGSSSERSFTGEDALPLADEISTWIRVGIGHSPEEGGSLPDRPLSEMLTDDAHAFRLYSEGIREALVSNDEPGAISAFEGAVEVDPGFVLAQHALSEVYADLGQVEDAVAALEAAVVHLDRLPERARFRVRADHQWLVEGDPEEALRELERWADRHPRDVVAFHRKAEVLSEIGRHDDAIEALGLAFDGGSSETRALFRLGDPWLERGDTTAALKYYRTFEGLEPQWKGTLRSLAEADRAAGDLERARGRLQMLALLAPTDPQVWADLGVIVAGLGDPGAGFSLHEEGLARAETPEDRVWAL